jgi:hypothetical protein
MFDFVIRFFNWVPDIIWLLILVYFLGRMTWAMWIHYIQQDFISGIDYVLLEIVPPRDVLRSPRAMELFFTNALYHWSLKGGREEYWQGAVWFWYSLEIVSIEGQVHFYIRTPSRIKGLIETQMYAQYPQAQVKVVDDYTLAVDAINPDSEWNLWGCEWKLEKPDPYPIKTYVDFGLDKDPKEEFKIDPISPIIELFAAIEKGEQMWLQIVIRPSKKEFKGIGGKKHDWVKEGELELDKIAAPYTKIETLPDGTILKSGRPPDQLKPLFDGITKKIQKIGFDVGIRTCYVAKKPNYNMSNRRNLRLIFRQYANPFLNQFTRVNATQADAYGGLVTVLNQEQVYELANRMLGEYRARSFYHGQLRQDLFSVDRIPWPISPMFFKAYKPQPTFVLNVEEIATIWHFPGQILKIPTLERVESKEASPPTNLPI